MAKAEKTKLWRCPKCKSEISAIAIEVTHKCPSNKSQITKWELE